MNPYLKICIKMFFFTRIFFISIILLLYGTNIISKYDLSSDILSTLTPIPNSQNFFEKILSKFLSYFSSYDAIHFILIAKHDYFNDNIFAFFPLFPWLIRGFARLFELIPFKNEYMPFLISGFIISNIICLGNCLLIFAVIYKLTNCRKKAKICSFLFLINPGTIFYISIYSENLYLMLQLIFVNYVIKSGEEKFSELKSKIIGDVSEKKPTYFFQIACLIIGLLMTRSNSITLCTYFIIPSLLILFYKEKYMRSFMFFSFYHNLCQFIKILHKVFREIGLYIVLCLHALLCFVYMTKYKPRFNICSNIRRGINKGVGKYDLFEKWCFKKGVKTGINSFYSYIQKEYWNVGFLNQYSFNTLDRVILALPMNILSIYILYKIYHYFDFGELYKEFNFGKFFLHNSIYEDKNILNHNDHEHKEVISNSYRNNITTNGFIIGGGLNYLINFLIVIFIAHPQINNRILSGCPILYLEICNDVVDFLENNKKGNYKRGFAILLFFISFAVLGCVMQVGSYGFA